MLKHKKKQINKKICIKSIQKNKKYTKKYKKITKKGYNESPPRGVPWALYKKILANDSIVSCVVKIYY